jgi:hypothetical protein
MKPTRSRAEPEPKPMESERKTSWWCGLSREEFSEKLRRNQPRITDSKFGKAVWTQSAVAGKGR